MRKVQSAGRSAPGRTPQLRLSLATFVPKPHTPFQWVAQTEEDTLLRRHEILKRGLGQRVKLSYTDTRSQPAGGGHVAGRPAPQPGHLYRAWQAGAAFDGWSECFNWALWQKAFADSGLDPDFYARRERPLDEPLPWAHIDVGLSADFLKAEYRRALSGELTPYCRTDGCNLCGLEGWGVGCP